MFWTSDHICYSNCLLYLTQFFYVPIKYKPNIESKSIIFVHGTIIE